MCRVSSQSWLLTEVVIVDQCCGTRAALRQLRSISTDSKAILAKWHVRLTDRLSEAGGAGGHRHCYSTIGPLSGFLVRLRGLQRPWRAASSDFLPPACQRRGPPPLPPITESCSPARGTESLSTPNASN